MTALRSLREVTPATGDTPGGAAADRLAPAIERVRAWAGDGLVALVVSGSHASGDAVWATVGSRAVSLSDLDLWVVMADDDAVREASRRARADRDAAMADLRAAGFVAPVETGFVTAAGLSQMPAKPGTLELKRRGRVVLGDPDVRRHVPDYRPADIPAEERWLLLENRSFELLLAWPQLVETDAIACLLGRHAVLKVAADLATVSAMSESQLPEGRAGRIAWARAHRDSLEPGPFGSNPESVDALWDAALEFVRDPRVAPGADAARAEWLAVARAWSDTWWSLVAGAPAGAPAWDAALRVARRAPWWRRARRAWTFRARTGEGPDRGRRLRDASAGTPQHRVNASATVLVLAAAAGLPPAMPFGALRALGRLGIVDANDARDWDRARAVVVRAWDRWLHDGVRTAESR